MEFNQRQFSAEHGESQRERVLTKVAEGKISPLIADIVENHDPNAPKASTEDVPTATDWVPPRRQNEVERIDALLTVLRNHGVVDFRGCGIDVRLEPHRPSPVKVETSDLVPIGKAAILASRAGSALAGSAALVGRSQAQLNYVPPHVDPSKPEPDQVVEPKRFNLEDALYGAGAE